MAMQTINKMSKYLLQNEGLSIYSVSALLTLSTSTILPYFDILQRNIRLSRNEYNLTINLFQVHHIFLSLDQNQLCILIAW